MLCSAALMPSWAGPAVVERSWPPRTRCFLVLTRKAINLLLRVLVESLVFRARAARCEFEVRCIYSGPSHSMSTVNEASCELCVLFTSEIWTVSKPSRSHFRSSAKCTLCTNMPHGNGLTPQSQLSWGYEPISPTRLQSDHERLCRAACPPSAQPEAMQSPLLCLAPGPASHAQSLLSQPVTQQQLAG
jgi:ferredoxin